jgi:hypothetical protein
MNANARVSEHTPTVLVGAFKSRASNLWGAPVLFNLEYKHGI